MNQKGISPILLLLVIVGVLIIGAGVWYYWVQKTPVGPGLCPADTKICPDGTAVRRISPVCEFESCPEVKKDETTDWKTYRNEEFMFEIKYPVDWTLYEVNEYGNIALFIPPGDIKEMLLRFIISIQEINGLSLEEFNSYYLAELGEGKEGFDLSEIEGRDVSLAGKPAYQIIMPVYQIGDINKKWKGKSVWVLHDNNAYILTFSGPAEDFDNYRQSFEKMLSTFRFIK